MSYLRLELAPLEPSGVYERVSGEREEVTETAPRRYEERSLWEDGERDESWRLVRRWLRGTFVIFSKGSLYNAFGRYWAGDTYDGCQNRMTAEAFRSFVERIAIDARARGLPLD